MTNTETLSHTGEHRPVAAGVASASAAGTARLLGALADSLAEHHRKIGALPTGPPDRLLAQLEAAGLSGRGGAGFPTWHKLAAVAAAAGSPVAIANGAEGEPASAKDRVLQARAPHLVLDGLQLAAAMIGADRVLAYTPQGAAGASMSRAVAERRRAGWDPRPVQLLTAPDTFVAGQESAVVAAAEGRPALPRDVPQLVIHSGVHGRPTLVQNVETLAHLALIARHGAAWFRAAGTTAEPGTFLATVSGAVAAPGVYEFDCGARIDSILSAAGGATEPPRAVLVGGYHGSWLPAERALQLPMSRAGLASHGASPGAGVLQVLPVSACGLVESERILRYLAGQSAAQCGPCLNGLPALAAILARITNGAPGLLGSAERLIALVQRRGACHHPDGTARLASSVLEVFGTEIELHGQARCSATPHPSGRPR